MVGIWADEAGLSAGTPELAPILSGYTECDPFGPSCHHQPLQQEGEYIKEVAGRRLVRGPEYAGVRALGLVCN